MGFRSAEVLVGERRAGRLREYSGGYRFEYYPIYLNLPDAEPVSLTLPLGGKKFESKVLFAFFDGLIPEGWLLAVAEKVWKLNPRDRMGLLLSCCGDCIGRVSIVPQVEDE